MSPLTTTAPLVVSVFLDQPILAVIYLVTIAVAVWLFRDALRRGKSIIVAAIWAVGVLILPPIVFFAYLYLRLKTEGSMTEPPISDSE
ncbi:hypothetical protein halTADL_0332 [Halohasta litchfieldiae]|jgi:hypothetical protein|uniref:Phospholipase_D-nuclease N-terminal n=1 Tax=Halohasta litchfieldiae TaxID=1073996 RepID=A0A1H6TX88_9EURY|nr:hypothetical protein [Halohasta litchfieldiae]ATW87148.1 hypothetical protein halTADL_0332 [Halohasta litchfieldiae]SEI84621.1 hypothetical protein SAMN05444271_10975 [Halohasta litchfieldiae]